MHIAGSLLSDIMSGKEWMGQVGVIWRLYYSRYCSVQKRIAFFACTACGPYV